MFTVSPFDQFVDFTSPFHDRVYVISDSQYAEMQKADALRQLQKLERQRQRYQYDIDVIDAKIHEIKERNDLLPAAAESKEEASAKSE